MKTSIPTRVGVFEAEFRDQRLTMLRFPTNQKSNRGDSNSAARELEKELDEYLRGNRRTFSVAVDLSMGTRFQQQVWQALTRIPYGETKSYGQIALEIGSPGAARAVGSACGQNPVPIIVPCHRVIAHDHGIGGFSSGLHWKKMLLALESKAQAISSRSGTQTSPLSPATRSGSTRQRPFSAIVAAVHRAVRARGETFGDEWG